MVNYWLHWVGSPIVQHCAVQWRLKIFWKIPNKCCPLIRALFKKNSKGEWLLSGCTHSVCSESLGTFLAQQRESAIGYKKNGVSFPLKHPAGFEVWLNSTWEKVMLSVSSPHCANKRICHTVKSPFRHKITSSHYLSGFGCNSMISNDNVIFPVLFKLLSVFSIVIFCQWNSTISLCIDSMK